MNHLIDFFFSPFSEFMFMRHALVACLALGTLLAVGMLMLPAAAANFWARPFWSA